MIIWFETLASMKLNSLIAEWKNNSLMLLRNPTLLTLL